MVPSGSISELYLQGGLNISIPLNMSVSQPTARSQSYISILLRMFSTMARDAPAVLLFSRGVLVGMPGPNGVYHCYSRHRRVIIAYVPLAYAIKAETEITGVVVAQSRRVRRSPFYRLGFGA